MSPVLRLDGVHGRRHEVAHASRASRPSRPMRHRSPKQGRGRVSPRLAARRSADVTDSGAVAVAWASAAASSAVTARTTSAPSRCRLSVRGSVTTCTSGDHSVGPATCLAGLRRRRCGRRPRAGPRLRRHGSRIGAATVRAGIRGRRALREHERSVNGLTGSQRSGHHMSEDRGDGARRAGGRDGRWHRDHPHVGRREHDPRRQVAGRDRDRRVAGAGGETVSMTASTARACRASRRSRPAKPRQQSADA